MSQSLAGAALVTLFAIPFLWSAVVFLARAASVRPDQPLLREGTERGLLLAMIAPAALGAAFLLARLAAPAGAPLPSFPEIAGAGALVGAAGGDNAAAAQGGGVFRAAPLLLGLYALGLTVSVLRLLLGERRAARIAAEARELPGMYGRGVFVTKARITPFASACGKVIAPRILFDTLPADQAAAVIRHERAHLDRGDPAFYRRLAWCEAVFWWNPAVRHQIERCRLVAELACDRAAVGDRPDAAREFARSLLAMLRTLSVRPRLAAFTVPSAAGARSHALRLRALTQRAAPPALTLSRASRLALIGLLAPFAAAQAAGSDLPAAAEFSAVPAEGRISSGFGQRRHPVSGEMRLHSGLDIAAPSGTPVLAPAAGVVTRTAMDAGGYGNLIEIEHGGGATTRYAQLSAIDVEEGDRVAAGDAIGKVGSSGQSTGPHLHLELYLDGEPVDPASLIPMPAAAGR